MAGIDKVLKIPLGRIKHHAAEDNPKGFFENRLIIELNDRILKRFNTSWETFGAGSEIPASGILLSSFRKEALRLLETDYRDYDILAIKDPRISLLLPFWEDVLREFGAKSCRIISLRHPLEVALSQQVRYQKFPQMHRCGQELPFGLNLWFWYTIRLLNTLPDDDNLVVLFERLLEDPACEMNRISRLLNRPVNPEGLEEYTGHFLERTLRHHAADAAQTEPYRQPYSHIFELYTRLLEYADKENLPGDEARNLLCGLPDEQFLQSWSAPLVHYFRAEQKAVKKSSRRLQGLEERNTAWQDRLRIAKGPAEEQPLPESGRLRNHAEIRKQIDTIEHTLVSLREELARKDQLLTEGNRALTEERQTRSGLQAEKEKALHAIHGLQTELAQKDRLLAEENRALAAERQARIDLQAEKEQAVHTIHGLQAELAQKEQLLTERNRVLTAERQVCSGLQAEKEQALQALQCLQTELAQKDRLLADRNKELDAEEHTRINLRIRNEKRKHLIREIKKQISRREQRFQEMDAVLAKREEDIRSYREELFSVYTSRSWRYTALLRKVRKWLRRISILPYQPPVRTVLKQAYKSLPVFIRSRHSIEACKKHYKRKEMLKKLRIKTHELAGSGRR